MLKKLLEDRAATWDKMLAIRGRAEADHRDFTRAERAEWDAGEAKIDTITREIEKVQKRDAAAKAMPSSAIDFGTGAGFYGGPDSPGEFRKGQPLAPEQRVSDWAAAMGMVREEERELDFGRYIRGLALGDWRDADAERRAMAEGTLTAGGNMVPTLLATEIVDLARNKAAVFNAGARIVPMANAVENVARWATDPTPAWRSENAAITQSDATVQTLQLKAKSLSVITLVSRELLEDADAATGASISDALKNAFAQQMALNVDYAALYGTGTDPMPRGVKNTSGVTIQSMATNGATPTNYDFLVNALGTLRGKNEEPTAIVYSPRTEQELATLKDSQNRYLTPPPVLDNIPQHVTAQVPNNLTVGTGTTTSDAFVADWRQLYIGIRTQLQISLLSERFSDTGQIGFLAWMRADVAVARPNAFFVETGIL